MGKVEKFKNITFKLTLSAILLYAKKKNLPEKFFLTFLSRFYLAGYIENWGRGIQKIFETCHSLDIPEPSYSVLGNTITVKFPALQNASITITNDGNHDGNLTEIESLVYKALQENPRLSAVKMAETLQVSRPTIERAEKSLKGKGYIARQGKTRGIWIILKK